MDNTMAKKDYLLLLLLYAIKDTTLGISTTIGSATLVNNFTIIFRQIELKVQLWTMSGIEEMLQRIYDMQIKQMRAIRKLTQG